MVTLADLRVRNVLPTWNEAVAVVQELVHAVHATTGSSENLPGPDGIRLLAGGEVLAAPGSTRAENPVGRAADLLALLTEGVPMPGELQALVEANLTVPPQHATVDAFSTALAFFERPHRRADVEALVARVMESAAHADAAEELERLRARVFQSAEAEPAAEPETSDARRSHLPLVVAAAALLIFGASAGYYVWATSAHTRTAHVQASPPVAPTIGDADTSETAGETAAPVSPVSTASLFDRAREQVSAAVHAARESLGASRVEKAAPEAAVVEAPPAAAAAKPRPRAPRRAAQADGTDAATVPAADPTPAGSPVPPQINAAIEALNAAAAASPATIASTVSDAARLYSAEDEDVLPPLMVRPMIPTEPPANVPPERIGTLELIVDEYGNVERVRLLPQPLRYQEKMFVAHAKSWRFQPAMRNGQPVKYQLRLRLTI
jgi:hypothetical protein